MTKAKSKKVGVRKVRKPRNFRAKHGYVAFFKKGIDLAGPAIDIVIESVAAKECRKLSAWLLKAADYIEQQRRK